MNDGPDNFWFRCTYGREFLERLKKAAACSEEWRGFWEIIEEAELEDGIEPF